MQLHEYGNLRTHGTSSYGVAILESRLPHLPRAPDTLAGVMSYLCNSRMLEEFEGCETLGNGEFEKRIVAGGKTYEYRRNFGMDRKIRWMIVEKSTTLL